MHHKRYLLLFIVVLLLFRTGLPEIYYPWKDVYIGALENRGWAGLVLAASVDSIFAFRLQATKDGVTADGMDFLYLVSEVGPHSPVVCNHRQFSWLLYLTEPVFLWILQAFAQH
ncbi:MAG: hypothetical protein KKD59_10735, partial [Acidobacteria bacterium]|nr:hypothetical protein [Acidobacteriota bacterium]